MRREGTGAGWFTDPTGVHALRYWTGDEWSDYVSDKAGEERLAPLHPSLMGLPPPRPPEVKRPRSPWGVGGCLFAVVTFVAAVVCLGAAFGGADSGSMSDGEVHTYSVLFFVFLGLFFASLVFTLGFELRRGVQDVKGQQEARGWVRIVVAIVGFVAILVLARWYVTGGW